MKIDRTLLAIVAFTLASGATLASASGVTYTCNADVNAIEPGMCAELNSFVSGQYASLFSNANTSIYVEFNSGAGLGASTSGYFNEVSYSTYYDHLAAEASTTGGPIMASAVLNLPPTERAIYGGGEVELTSALEEALGIGAGVGTTAPNPSDLTTLETGSACFTPGSNGCYNGILWLSTPANLPGGQGYYFGTGSGSGAGQSGNEYGVYSVVEHETDEILGTASCISTTNLTSLVDDCGGTSPSAVDLDRYQSPGTPVLISETSGAYFSYNGGVTNGADGAIYNTLPNGNDYADFNN